MWFQAAVRLAHLASLGGDLLLPKALGLGAARIEVEADADRRRFLHDLLFGLRRLVGGHRRRGKGYRDGGGERGAAPRKATHEYRTPCPVYPASLVYHWL